MPNPIPKFSGPLDPPPHPWLGDGEPPVFVHTSNMTPWKRLDLLLGAFADLRQAHDARLLIVGEGPGRSGADEQIRQLGLSGCAETVGWVDDPLQFAAQAWAFVLPSDEEGFAQVLTEAMSVGCPVITTDAQGGGPRFVTEDGAYGLLVPRGDQARLAEAMARMLEPEIRARVLKARPAAGRGAVTGSLRQRSGRVPLRAPGTRNVTAGPRQHLPRPGDQTPRISGEERQERAGVDGRRGRRRSAPCRRGNLNVHPAGFTFVIVIKGVREEDSADLIAAVAGW